MPPIFPKTYSTGAAILAALMVPVSVFAQDFDPQGDVVSRVIELQQPFQQTADKAATTINSQFEAAENRLAKNPVSDFVGEKSGSATKTIQNATNQFSPSKVEYDVIGSRPLGSTMVQSTPVNSVSPPVPKSTTAPTSVSFSKNATNDKEIASPAKMNRASKTPIITAEVVTPEFVNINEPTDVKIHLRNAGSQKVQRTLFSIALPEGTEFLSSNPKPVSQQDGLLNFEIAGISSNQDREIALRVIPREKRTMSFETQLQIIEAQTVAVSVREPKLILKVDGPAQVNIGETTTHTVTISNTGDGYAKAVRLQGNFPDELRFVNQEGMNAPKTLAPGKSMKVQIKSLAKLPGSVKLDFTAEGVGIKANPAAANLRIAQPELKVLAAGPNMNFVDQDGIYTIKIDNSGEVSVSNVNVVLSIPEGMKVTTISRQAKMNESAGSLQWSFPKIKARTTETIQLKATATKPGQQVCSILVSSKETREKEFKLSTQIATRANLSINMQNQSGPVRVGGNATFDVVVENRGSSSASDIEVTIELPESLMPVKDTGLFIDEGANKITFLDSQLARGEKRQFSFEVVGVAQGEHIVRSVLKTSKSERRVIVEDSVFVFETNEARVSENLSPVMPR